MGVDGMHVCISLGLAMDIWTSVLTGLDLNEKITNFLSMVGERLTREEWLWRYPRATEEIA